MQDFFVHFKVWKVFDDKQELLNLSD